ncbi:MAG: D-Ala-D-Ala carboxypeptidase family metallohydrolase [Candidatus Kapaibacterium sp.]
MKLTDNFSLEEMSISAMAVRKGVDNVPGEAEIKNLQILCEKILEPIREEVNCSIRVFSGYRSLTVNKLVGGSLTSQHMHGEAADTIAIGMSVEDYYQRIKKMVKDNRLVVDQVIQEFNSWVHISFTITRANRKQFLRAVKDSHGHTEYKSDNE